MDRLASRVSPLAVLYARRMGPAFEALCTQACMDSALAGALVGQGMDPGTAHMVVQQAQALGLTISPSVYAPAHVLEATAMGTAVPTAQRVAASMPWIPAYMAQLPGYEPVAQWIPPGTAPAAALMEPRGVTAAAPGWAKGVGPGPGKAAGPGKATGPGKAAGPGVAAGPMHGAVPWMMPGFPAGGEGLHFPAGS